MDLNITTQLHKRTDEQMFYLMDLNMTTQLHNTYTTHNYTYYDTTTQKEEKVEFHDYHYHLKNFGFTWEHKQLQLKYEITLSSDEKTRKKLLWVTI